MPKATIDLPKDMSVINALLERRDNGYQGDGADGRRIAIVVGGGGMRGGSTGGMVLALEEAGLSDCFDVAYGSSSGAFIASAMVHRRGASASRVFPDDMSASEFIDLRRLIRRTPVMSLDHLLDQILTHSKPINWEAALAHPTPVRIVATDAETMRPEVLEPLSTKERWQTAFRATSAVPGFAGGPVEFDGRLWIDGSVAEPLPAMRAVAEGATHVLALIARSEEELVETETTIYTRAERRALNALSPGLGEMLQGREHYEREITQLRTCGAAVYAMATPVSCGVRALTRDVVKIERAVNLGYITAQATLYQALHPAQS